MRDQLGLADDSEFFDWGAELDQRFFLAPEVVSAGGYSLRVVGPASAPARLPLPAPQPSPRSFS